MAKSPLMSKLDFNLVTISRRYSISSAGVPPPKYTEFMILSLYRALTISISLRSASLNLLAKSFL